MATVSKGPWKTIYDQQKPHRYVKRLCFVGIILLAHSAWSITQYHQSLSTNEIMGILPPFEMTLECLCGLILCLLGVALFSTRLKPICDLPELATRQWDSLFYREEFAMLNHRGTRARNQER